MKRTRIKICGITREQDIDAAVAAGVDAIGFVFYPQSARYITPQRANVLAKRLPPFVTAVGLFVNAMHTDIAHVLEHVPLTSLQFHGDETVDDCVTARKKYHLPVIRALRVQAGTDVLSLAERFIQHGQCSAVLLDTWVDQYGGSGKAFDWSLVPSRWLTRTRPHWVLSGGLTAHNVAQALTNLRPDAVDVSSGVENGTKGYKDVELIRAFVAAVHAADAMIKHL